MLKKSDIRIIFNPHGGCTIQTPQWAHLYFEIPEAVRQAFRLGTLEENEDGSIKATRYIDANQPENRLPPCVFTYNGMRAGYIIMDLADFNGPWWADSVHPLVRMFHACLKALDDDKDRPECWGIFD